MFKNLLRAAIFAIAGIAVAAPAYADGKVETAMKLWMGDLNTTYTATVADLSSGNINQGKTDLASLLDKISKMNDAVSGIVQSSNALAPELVAMWTDSQSSLSAFNDATKALASTIGQQTPDLNALKTTQSNADTALHKSWNGTIEFGKRYAELTGSSGYIESAYQLFRNGVTQAFTDTYDDLNAGSTEEGVQNLAKLRSATKDLEIYITKGDSGAKTVARNLSDLWSPIVSSFNKLQVNIGRLENVVSSPDYKSVLEDLRDAYSDMNDRIKSVYASVQDFGSKLKAICDDWS